MAKIWTRLRLSGIDLTLRSDEQISVTLRQIDAAGDLRRDVNGGLVRVSRSAFDKFSVSISGSGLNAPPLSHLKAGDYIEVVLADHVYMTLGATLESATYPRAAADIEGWTITGRRIEPTAQPSSALLALSTTLTPSRVANLRAPIVANFPEPVHAARCRPILACRVISWDLQNEDASKDASWSLELEEA